MKFTNIDGVIWKGLFVILSGFISKVLSNPLLGPHLMGFDEVAPFSEWEGPQLIFSPEINPLGAGSPAASGSLGPGTGSSTAGGPQSNIIRLPCVGGTRQTGSGCRPEFRLPSASGVFRGDTRLYRGRQMPVTRGRVGGGPRRGFSRGGRVLNQRPEPETPDPEQIRGDD